jgi:hypothetical protein
MRDLGPMLVLGAFVLAIAALVMAILSGALGAPWFS